MIFDKSKKLHIGERHHHACRRIQIDLYLSTSTKRNSKWIYDQSLKPDTPNQIEKMWGTATLNSLALMTF